MSPTAELQLQQPLTESSFLNPTEPSLTPDNVQRLVPVCATLLKWLFSTPEFAEAVAQQERDHVTL